MKRISSGWRMLAALGLAFAAAAPAAAADGTVSGKFLGNGKQATLAHAVAVPAEEKWQGEDAYTVVLTEQPPKPDGKADWDAGFGELGAALVIHVTRKGDLYGTEIFHPALEHKPFSSSGTLELGDFKLEGGKISGHFYTKQENEFFGDHWSVDVTFSAPIQGGS
jgi:hypothetical protein